MAKNNLTIYVSVVWLIGDEVIPCSLCKDLIVGGSNMLATKMVGDKLNKIEPSNIVVCNSCKDLIKQ